MATKTQTQTAAKPAAAAPKLRSVDEITGYLVKAQTVFKTVATAEGAPLLWDTELKFARDIVMNDTTETIRKSTPESLQATLEQIAHVGLTLNPIKHHCTIIARWNKAIGFFEAQFQPMYRGLVYLATQAGVHDIDADVVYKADSFKVGRDKNGGYVEHEIAVAVPRTEEGNFFIGAYVLARMPKSGERKVEWVPAEDIFRMRDQSESYLDSELKPRLSSPWVRWFDEMAKKSALKRASKRWEESIERNSQWQRFQRAVDQDNRIDGGSVIEGTATVVEEPKLSLEQVAQIESKARELGHGDVSKYLRKVCNAYGAEVLTDVPATKLQEILERIAVSKAERDKRASTDKK